MARLPETDHFKRLDGLRDELDSMRKQIDAARSASFNRRKAPERRVQPRPTPDRRGTSASRG